MKQVQTDYIIFASTLGFNIIWQVNGQVKIKVLRIYTVDNNQYEVNQMFLEIFHITELKKIIYIYIIYLSTTI